MVVIKSSITAIKMAFIRVKMAFVRVSKYRLTRADKSTMFYFTLAAIVALIPVVALSLLPGPILSVNQNEFEKIYAETTHSSANPFVTHNHNIEHRKSFYFYFSPNSTKVVHLFNKALQLWVVRKPSRTNITIHTEGFYTEADMVDKTRKLPLGAMIIATHVNNIHPNVLDYKIRYRSCKNDLLRTDIKFEYNQGVIGRSPYLKTPFVSWQASIEQGFIAMRKHVKPFWVSIRRFPHPHSSNVCSFKQAVDLVATVVMCSCILPMLGLMKHIIDKKHSVLKRPNLTWYHVLEFVSKRSLICLILLMVLCSLMTGMYLFPLPNGTRILRHTNPLLLFCLFTFYAANILYVTVLIALAFKTMSRAILALLVAFPIPFALIQHFYFLPLSNIEYVDVTLTESSAIWQLLLCLHPSGAFLMAMRMIACLGASGIRATWSSVMIIPDGGYKWNLLVVTGCMGTFLMVQLTLVQVAILYPCEIAPYIKRQCKKLFCFKHEEEHLHQDEDEEDPNVIRIVEPPPDVEEDLPSFVEHWSNRLFNRCRANDFHINSAITRISIPFIIFYVSYLSLPQSFELEQTWPPLTVDLHAVSYHPEVTYASDADLSGFFSSTYLPLMQENGIHVMHRQSNIQKYLVDKAISEFDRYIEAYVFGGSGNLVDGKMNLTAWYNGDLLHALPMSLNLMHTAILRNITGDKNALIKVTNAPLPFPRDFQASVLEEKTHISSVLSIVLPITFGFMAASYVTDPIFRPLFEKIHILCNGHLIPLYWAGTYFWHMFCYFMVCVVLHIPSLMFTAVTGINVLDIDNAITMLSLMFGWSSLPFGYVLFRKMGAVSIRYSTILVMTMITGIGLWYINPIMQGFLPEPLNNYVLNMFPVYAVTKGMTKAIQQAFSLTTCSRISPDVLQGYCETNVACHLNACCNDNVTSADSYPSVNMWRENGCGEELFFLFITGILYFAIFFCVDTRIFKICRKLPAKKPRRKKKAIEEKKPEDATA